MLHNLDRYQSFKIFFERTRLLVALQIFTALALYMGLAPDLRIFFSKILYQFEVQIFNPLSSFCWLSRSRLIGHGRQAITRSIWIAEKTNLADNDVRTN
jgi:hypothetical protein